jgi:hypothetical protein
VRRSHSSHVAQSAQEVYAAQNPHAARTCGDAEVDNQSSQQGYQSVGGGQLDSQRFTVQAAASRRQRCGSHSPPRFRSSSGHAHALPQPHAHAHRARVSTGDQRASVAFEGVWAVDSNGVLAGSAVGEVRDSAPAGHDSAPAGRDSERADVDAEVLVQGPVPPLQGRSSRDGAGVKPAWRENSVMRAGVSAAIAFVRESGRAVHISERLAQPLPLSDHNMIHMPAYARNPTGSSQSLHASTHALDPSDAASRGALPGREAVRGCSDSSTALRLPWQVPLPARRASSPGLTVHERPSSRLQWQDQVPSRGASSPGLISGSIMHGQ